MRPTVWHLGNHGDRAIAALARFLPRRDRQRKATHPASLEREKRGPLWLEGAASLPLWERSSVDRFLYLYFYRYCRWPPPGLPLLPLACAIALKSRASGRHKNEPITQSQ